MNLRTVAVAVVLLILIVATVLAVGGWGSAQEAGRLKSAVVVLLATGYVGLGAWTARALWWNRAENEWKGVIRR